MDEENFSFLWNSKAVGIFWVVGGKMWELNFVELKENINFYTGM
jgi:hypothetical protein